MKPIQVGLLGIGTVGSGVFNVLTRNQDEISRRAGRGIQISHHGDLNATSGTAGNFFLVATQNVERAAADGAYAQKAYLDGCHDFSQ